MCLLGGVILLLLRMCCLGVAHACAQDGQAVVPQPACPIPAPFIGRSRLLPQHHACDYGSFPIPQTHDPHTLVTHDPTAFCSTLCHSQPPPTFVDLATTGLCTMDWFYSHPFTYPMVMLFVDVAFIGLVYIARWTLHSVPHPHYQYS